MIKGIAHLCIRVADLGRTARFYCEGLGLEKAFDFRRDDKTVGFYLKAGNGNYLEFRRLHAGREKNGRRPRLSGLADRSGRRPHRAARIHARLLPENRPDLLSVNAPYSSLREKNQPATPSVTAVMRQSG